jgi:predicted 3-demethylubiquinone-9 3-methyltransferase (glyoxalase superfamily)
MNHDHLATTSRLVLKDRYGLSWQVVSRTPQIMLRDGDAGRMERVTRAFLQMRKFDIAALERAWAGAAIP